MGVDFTTFAGTVNREFEQFKISSITDEQFKYLNLVYESMSAQGFYRRKKIEQNPNVTLQQAAEEGQRLVNLKQDSDMVQ